MADYLSPYKATEHLAIGWTDYRVLLKPVPETAVWRRFKMVIAALFAPRDFVALRRHLRGEPQRTRVSAALLSQRRWPRRYV